MVELHPRSTPDVERPRDRLGRGSVGGRILGEKTPRIEGVDADRGEHHVVGLVTEPLQGELLLLDEPAVEPREVPQRRLHVDHVTRHARHPQPAEAGDDAEGDRVARAAAGKPRPAAVVVPQAFETIERRAHLGHRPVRVEGQRDPRPCLPLIDGVAHPRRLRQERLHEPGVPLERALEHRATGESPLLEHAADARVARREMPGQRVRVEPREERLRALVGLLRDRGEREDGVPRRIGHGLHDERLAADRGARARGQALERHPPLPGPPDRDRHGLGHRHAPRQHRQVGLLAVGGFAGGAGGEIPEDVGAVGHPHREHDGPRLTRCQIERLHALPFDEPATIVVGARVGKREPHGAGEPAGRRVAHLHGNLHEIPLADEPRHEGLDHEILRGDAGVLERAAAHERVVREAPEPPRGERVGERELDRDGAGGVARERRQEERRLHEILPRRRRGGGSLAGGSISAAVVPAVRELLVEGALAQFAARRGVAHVERGGVGFGGRRGRGHRGHEHAPASRHASHPAPAPEEAPRAGG